MLALFPKKCMGDMQIFWRRDFDVFQVTVHQLNRVASEFKNTGIVREFRTVSAAVCRLQSRQIEALRRLNSPQAVTQECV